MQLKGRKRFDRPAQMNLANNGVNAGLIWGTTQTFEIPRDRPIEELIVRVTATVLNAAAITLTGLDNVLGMCRRIRVNRPAGSQQPAGSVVVDYRGIGLIEYCANTGMNLDEATLQLINLSQGATIASGQVIRCVCRIPLVHPVIGEPLRSRCLLPAHTWQASPTISIDFEQEANMYTGATAGHLGNVIVEIGRVTRYDDPNQTAQVLKGGGYIPMDLIESSFSVAPGVSNEQRLPIPLPGKYLGLQFCHYLGGAAVTRQVPDANITPGSETKVSMQIGGDTRDEFLWSQFQTLNSFSRPRNGLSTTTYPASGLPVAAGNNFPNAASVYYDALTDGIGTDTQAASELGSVIDADAAFAVGQKIEFVFIPANVATNATTIFYGGHRLWGDLSPYQVLQGA